MSNEANKRPQVTMARPGNRSPGDVAHPVASCFRTVLVVARTTLEIKVLSNSLGVTLQQFSKLKCAKMSAVSTALGTAAILAYISGASPSQERRGSAASLGRERGWEMNAVSRPCTH